MTFNEWWTGAETRIFYDRDWGMTDKELAQEVWELARQQLMNTLAHHNDMRRDERESMESLERRHR